MLPEAAPKRTKKKKKKRSPDNSIADGAVAQQETLSGLATGTAPQSAVPGAAAGPADMPAGTATITVRSGGESSLNGESTSSADSSGASAAERTHSLGTAQPSSLGTASGRDGALISGSGLGLDPNDRAAAAKLRGSRFGSGKKPGDTVALATGPGESGSSGADITGKVAKQKRVADDAATLHTDASTVGSASAGAVSVDALPSTFTGGTAEEGPAVHPAGSAAEATAVGSEHNGSAAAQAGGDAESATKGADESAGSGEAGVGLESTDHVGTARNGPSAVSDSLTDPQTSATSVLTAGIGSSLNGPSDLQTGAGVGPSGLSAGSASLSAARVLEPSTAEGVEELDVVVQL